MHSFLTEATEAYTRQMEPSVGPLLKDIEAYAHEHRVPIAARSVAQFQSMLVTATDANQVLEVGTAIGYTAIQLARAGADVVTLEEDADRITAAEEFIDEAGVADAIDIERGDATDILPGLDEQFDLVFIDARKDEYEQYLDTVVPLLRPGGLLVIDNLLWGGAVPSAAVDGGDPDSDVASLLEFNEEFVGHPRLQSAILPFGDGTGFAVKAK